MLTNTEAAPARTFCGKTILKCLSYILISASIVSIIICIVDVIMTYTICPPTGTRDPNCLPSASEDVWTWIASGIWASVPLFIIGIWTVCLLDRPGCGRYWYVIVLFAGTFVFCPAKIILNIIEAVKYGNNSSWTGGSYAYTKVVIPSLLAIIGFVEWLHVLIFFIQYVCCFNSDTDEEIIEYIDEMDDGDKNTKPKSTITISKPCNCSNNKTYQYQVPMNIPVYGVSSAVPAYSPRYIINSPSTTIPVNNGTGWNLNYVPSNVQYKIM